MKKAGERRVTTGFWRSDIAAFYGPSKRSNGNYYATYVLLYNDKTYECVSVNLGHYYEFSVYINCDELYGGRSPIYETRTYKSILGPISCAGADHHEALKIISEKAKAWRKIIKDYGERSYEVLLTAKAKTIFNRW